MKLHFRLGSSDSPRRVPGSVLGKRQTLKRLVGNTTHTLVTWSSVLLLAALVIIPLCLFIWLLFFTDVFNVKAVNVIDARDHTAKLATQLVEARLSQVPFQRNIFFVPSELITNDLKAKLPQVRTVQVTRSLPGTIRVVIQEKEPSALLLSHGVYYFVDQAGVPYERAQLDTLPGTILPTVKNNDQAGGVTIGVPVVTPSFIAFIQFVQENLSSFLPAQVVEIRIPSLAAREVHFLLDTNVELRLDVTRDAAAQLDVLRRVLTEIIPPPEQAALDYIDLRIKDRVYYRTSGAAESSSTPKEEDTTSDTE